MKLNEILKIVNAMEEKQIGFFSRTGRDMCIWIRGKHGNDPNQWSNARAIADAVRATESPKPDRLSGHLLIRLKDVYGNHI